MPRKKAVVQESGLTSRQRNLLFAVIKEYCDTGQGVGSKEVREKYGFDFSPATIRNEFVRLRDLGYLYQAFTNSSSQPTDKAYRLFIHQLIEGLQITNQRQHELRQHIDSLENQQTNLNKEIARLLAVQAGGVGFQIDEKTESISGIRNLLESPSEGKVSDILDFLDNLDQHKQLLLGSEQSSEQQQVLQGQLDLVEQSDINPIAKKQMKNTLRMVFGDADNPVVPLSKGYAMVATDVVVGEEKSVVGLIAPTHLLARKENLELVEALSQVLNDKGKNLEE
jgi:transcriptional regulator of heat shock response